MELSKKERHLRDLRKYSLADNQLISYLLEHSNLPGKRGNLELAASFADYIGEIYDQDRPACFQFCLDLIADYDEKRNEMGNEEFLPFCAVVALGRIGAIDASQRQVILPLLQSNAADGRWRVREAVAMAITDVVAADPHKTIAELQNWLKTENALVDRAIVAGLAEPRLMKNSEIARAALAIHQEIINRVQAETKTRDINFNVLVKGLCYTLSVIITGIPQQGFAYLEELVMDSNPIVRKIARENLKKNRLQLLNKIRVRELQERLNLI